MRFHNVNFFTSLEGNFIIFIPPAKAFLNLCHFFYKPGYVYRHIFTISLNQGLLKTDPSDQAQLSSTGTASRPTVLSY